MTHKGQAFELAFKYRELESGPEVYRACDSLQQTISRLYRQAGIKLGSLHSGRRSLAARDRRRGDGADHPGSPAPGSQPYLTFHQDTVRLAFELALG